VGLTGLVTRAVDSLAPGTSVMEACRLMDDKKVGALAVVEGHELRGIFTYRISSAESCSPSGIRRRRPWERS
jgi:CBS domain-containing protein